MLVTSRVDYKPSLQYFDVHKLLPLRLVSLRHIEASSEKGLVGQRMFLGQSRLEEHMRHYRAAQVTREKASCERKAKGTGATVSFQTTLEPDQRGAASWRFAPMVATASWLCFEHTGLARWAEFHNHVSDHFDCPLTSVALTFCCVPSYEN